MASGIGRGPAFNFTPEAQFARQREITANLRRSEPALRTRRAIGFPRTRPICGGATSATIARQSSRWLPFARNVETKVNGSSRKRSVNAQDLQLPASVSPKPDFASMAVVPCRTAVSSVRNAMVSSVRGEIS